MPPRPVRGEHGGLDEDYETKIWMKKKGIEFVRGGSYMQPELPGEAVQALRRELFHDAGTCVRCNSSDHYVAQCPIPSEEFPIIALFLLRQCLLSLALPMVKLNACLKNTLRW